MFKSGEQEKSKLETKDAEKMQIKKSQRLEVLWIWQGKEG